MSSSPSPDATPAPTNSTSPPPTSPSPPDATSPPPTSPSPPAPPESSPPPPSVTPPPDPSASPPPPSTTPPPQPTPPSTVPPPLPSPPSPPSPPSSPEIRNPPPTSPGSRTPTNPPTHKSPPSSPSTPSDSSPPSSSGGISTGLVVGIAVAGVAALVILTILCLCCKKKRRRRDDEAGYYIPPPPPPAPKDRPHGGQQQYLQQHNAPARSDHVVPAGPSPPRLPPPPQHHIPGYNQPPPPPPPPFMSSGGTSSGSNNPILPPPSPGLVLGFTKSTFSYEELARATNGFSDANLLGQGGFGYVHKGILPNGKEVAVKQLKAGSGQGEREFQAEVEIISRVHHKHLVSLVGYCITGIQRLLVYEFVPNDTLEFHLHGKGQPTMDWGTRLRIALGSAKGLAYLHEDCHPKIIHRDIKAANILVDFKFEAKVADFGLAKIASDTNTHVSTRVMGTFGYLAPEYASSGKLSDKSDVFSFGVVLLELITGRRPVDSNSSFMDDSLVDWARPMMTRASEDGDFESLADPKLREYDEDEMARMVACAAACVRHSARRRPRMSQIVRALEGNVSLSDLNEGIRPGHSTVFSSYGESTDYDSSQYNDDMKKFRKMALGSTNEYSEPTTEYGLNPSGSSSEGPTRTTTREMEMSKMKKKDQGYSGGSSAAS